MRPQDEVVEVEPARRRDRPLVRDEASARSARASGRPRPRSGVTPSSTLQARDRAVQLRQRRPSSAAGRELAQERRRDRRAAPSAAPASRRISRPERVERPDADRAPASTPSGASAASSRSPSSTAARRLNVMAAIVSGVDAGRSTSQAIAGDERRGLAAARGRDDQSTGRAARSPRLAGRAPVGRGGPPTDGCIDMRGSLGGASHPRLRDVNGRERRRLQCGRKVTTVHTAMRLGSLR